MTAPLLDQTVRSLRRTALDRQRTGRVPGLYAAVHRRGELLWGDGVGVVELGAGRSPGPDDQFLIASNSKTFTAVMVMQLRDEGRLTLDDRIADHVPEITHPTTVRQGLAHVSGLQREPVGNIWETLQQPTTEELLTGFAEAEAVGRPHDRRHYSNVVYAVLGELVHGSTGGRGRNRCVPACSSRSSCGARPSGSTTATGRPATTWRRTTTSPASSR